MEQLGTVKWFDDNKGYGFITPAGGGPDTFIHFSNIVAEGFKTLTKGQQVSFEAFIGPKGPSALDVKVVKDVSEEQKVAARRVSEDVTLGDADAASEKE